MPDARPRFSAAAASGGRLSRRTSLVEDLCAGRTVRPVEASCTEPAIPIGSGRVDYRATDERILRVAARVLTEDPAATPAGIAQQAGVSRATMYRHYSSVGALLEALRARALLAEDPARTRLLASLAQPEAPAAAIVAAFSTYLNDVFTALDTEVPGSPGVVTWDPELRRAVGEELIPVARDAIARLQRLGVASRDFAPEALAGMLGGVLLEAVRQVTCGQLAPRDAAALVQHTALIGLRARARRDPEVARA